MRPVFQVLSAAVLVAGWLVTGALLIVFYFTLFTAVALIGRLFGERFLDTRFKSGAISYWLPKSGARHDKRWWERQF